VISGRDDVGTTGPQLAGDLRGEPRPARGILTIHDREVDAQLGPQRRQERRDGVTAGSADDVTDEQDPHRGYFA